MARIEKGVGGVAVRILAVVLILIGLVPPIGGSFSYLLAGLGLVASGVMLWRLRLLGAWVHIAYALPER